MRLDAMSLIKRELKSLGRVAVLAPGSRRAPGADAPGRYTTIADNEDTGALRHLLCRSALPAVCARALPASCALFVCRSRRALCCCLLCRAALDLLARQAGGRCLGDTGR